MTDCREATIQYKVARKRVVWWALGSSCCWRTAVYTYFLVWESQKVERQRFVVPHVLVPADRLQGSSQKPWGLDQPMMVQTPLREYKVSEPSLSCFATLRSWELVPRSIRSSCYLDVSGITKRAVDIVMIESFLKLV